MSMMKIIKETESLLRQHFHKLLPIYLAIEILMLAVNLISNQIVAIFGGIVFVTLSHAYVITSLKCAENRTDEIQFKDCFVGMTNFVKLFPAYIMRKLILNVISLCILSPGLLLIRFNTGFALGEFLDWVRVIVVTGINEINSLSIVSDYLTQPILIICFSLASVISSFASFGLSMMPYLVEKYDISWNEAIMKSWRMTKGKKRQILFIQLFYLPRILLVYLSVNIISSLLAFVPFLNISITIFLAIYLPLFFYLPHIEIAMALFYQNLISQEEHKELFVI